MNVTDMAVDGAPELRVSVDKDLVMANGLTVAQVFMAVNRTLTAPEQSLYMYLSGRSYEIIISDGDFVLPNRTEIESLLISTHSGEVILSEIAEVSEDIGFTSINRINRNRSVTVTGEVEEGFNVGLVNAEIERLLQDFIPADGCSVIIGGEAEAINETFGELFLMLALGLVFIYLIMVAQFQSLLSPFIIMFTIPLAFTGGFLALMITRISLSVVAMIGLILLTGVAVNNGILLITRVNQMRREGMSKRDALIDAGRKRIRPILMTAISTIFAMSLIAFGIGEGSEMMQPMAVATIGGLLYATFTTLLVVPVMYDLFHKNKDMTNKELDALESA
jgi:HAE1 family hydrophobic/amphiphilic exporter-1